MNARVGLLSGFLGMAFRNGLMLNSGKTEAIVFGTATCLRCDESCPKFINFAGTSIKVSESPTLQRKLFFMI